MYRWIPDSIISTYTNEKMRIYNKCHVENGVSCIAMGIGVISEEFSYIGAKVAADTVVTMMTQRFNDLFPLNHDVLTKIVSDIINAEIISTTMKYSLFDPGLLSTSILFVAINGPRYIAGHLGMGQILTVNKNSYNVLSGDDISMIPEAYFLNPNKAVRHMRIYRGNSVNMDGFLLLSDTLSDMYNRDRLDISSLFTDSLNLDDMPEEYGASVCRYVHYTHEKLNKSSRDEISMYIGTSNSEAISNRMSILKMLEEGYDIPMIFEKSEMSMSCITDHIKSIRDIGIFIV